MYTTTVEKLQSSKMEWTRATGNGVGEFLKPMLNELNKIRKTAYTMLLFT